MKELMTKCYEIANELFDLVCKRDTNGAARILDEEIDLFLREYPVGSEEYKILQTMRNIATEVLTTSLVLSEYERKLECVPNSEFNKRYFEWHGEPDLTKSGDDSV